MPLEQRPKRLFWNDFLVFIVGGAALATFNFLVFDFPPDSGAKVLLGFAVIGLYAALDLTFQRERRLAQQLRAERRAFPLSARFLPYQTKFVLFSMINIVVVSLIVVMVVLKDLIWSATTDMDPMRAQLVIMVELVFILAVLGAYQLRVIRQYARKMDFSLEEETTALRRVKSGDLSSRVTISSNDEFGHMAMLTNDMIVRLQSALAEVERTRDVTINALVSLSAKRDNETGRHLRRTQLFAMELASELARTPRDRDPIDERFLDLLHRSAPLHDVGKVGVPDAILSKPGRLTAEEFEVMKEHARIGAAALADADRTLGGSSFLAMARDIALHHHERWDGTGYPDGLSGQDIPLAARLMAVADVYDALRSKRVYKPARPHAEARAIIVDGRGSHFDPDVVDAFLRVETEFERISDELQDPAVAPDETATAAA